MRKRNLRIPRTAMLVLGAAFSSMVLSGSASTGHDTLTVWGQVVDESTGAPMAGVQVMISELRLGTLTDARGGYVLREVPKAQHVLVARRQAYIPERRDLWGCVVRQGTCVPAADDVHRIDFYLRSEPPAQPYTRHPGGPVR